jgi:ribosomal protein S18 acetylase RimI-like enzyme
MTISCVTPTPDELPAVVAALAAWQRPDTPAQVHPGDVGWFWRFGVDRTAAAVRVWQRAGVTVAVGLLDEPDMLRVAVDPQLLREDELGAQLAADAAEPDRGVLIEGTVYVDAPEGSRVRDLLDQDGWRLDDPWTPLCRDLAEPVEDPGVAVEVVGPDTASIRTAVQRASFDGSTFTDERWHAMAAGSPYADAHCLLARDRSGEPVAAVTVWSAGPGRPGLLEPMGVHRDFRGAGHGRAITLAAAAALRELGACQAVVQTPSFNVGAVATYCAAGFQPQPEIRAHVRKA